MRPKARVYIDGFNFYYGVVRQSDSSAWSYPTVYVWKNEEKGSDVNLGARFVYDGCIGAYEEAVIVSNDSDLPEPVRIVTKRVGLPVHAVLPANPRTKKHRPKSVFIRDATSIVTSSISWNTLKQCQLPEVVVDARGRSIERPGSWQQAESAQRYQ